MLPKQKNQPLPPLPLENALTQSWGFRLFQQVCAEQPHLTNIFISPISLQIALGMVSHGAGGKTMQEIHQFIGLHKAQEAQRLHYFQNLLKEFSRSLLDTELLLANAIWSRDTHPPKPKFKEIVQTVYKSEIKTFSQETVSKTVQETNHKIPQVIEKIHNEDIMLLLNALYFKADWDITFPQQRTRPELFYGENREPYLVPMMTQSKSKLNYFENEVMQMVELPYKDHHFSMILLLPNAKLKDFLPSFNTENWAKWLKNLQNLNVSINLPKFRMECSMDMKEILIKLGMATPFNKQMADFTKLCEPRHKKEKIYISQILQKTFVEVNEAGTEAAAVTAIRISVSLSAPKIYFFKADRPFIFVIKDNKTNQPLFMGKMMNIV
jgi:serine protease inhibitor